MWVADFSTATFRVTTGRLGRLPVSDTLLFDDFNRGQRLMSKALRAWGTCIDCGYEGMLEYFRVEGESYEDEEALGLVMLLHCPACDSRENTLITMEYYVEISQGGADE
jgi:hypothetical protein